MKFAEKVNRIAGKVPVNSLRNAGKGVLAAALASATIGPIFFSLLPVGIVVGGLVGIGAACHGTAYIGARRMRRFAENYENCRPAKVHELTSVRQLAVEFLGEDVSTVERMEEWVNKNKRVFYVIYKKQSAPGEVTRKLVAYFSLIPLTAEGADAVRSGRQSGAAFDLSHIAGRGDKVCAYYVGAVVGRDTRARGIAMFKTQETLRKIIRGRKDVPLFGKAATSYGRRSLEETGFLPWPEGSAPGVGALYYLPAASVTQFFRETS